MDSTQTGARSWNGTQAEEDELLTFRASIPPLQSAINIHGSGDGVRIKIDIPQQDLDPAMAFIRQCQGKSFRLVVVRDDDEGEIRS